MKKHILLIDDDKDELKIFLDALHEVPGDFKCTYASDTQQGIEMLKYLVPDFIFVDFNMPKTNGLEFLAKIKKIQALENAMVYLYSTTINDSTNKKARGMGAAGCIEKPNSVSKLTDELKMIFDPVPSESYYYFKEK